MLGDLAVGQASRHEAENFDLPFAEAGRQRGSDARRRVPGRGEHSRRGIRVEPPGVRLLTEPGRRCVRLEGGPVRPRLGHRLVRVGRRENPCGGGQVSSLRRAVIAGAVESFVVHPGGRRERSPPRRSREDPFGVVGMQPNLLLLRAAERASLVPDAGRDRHLSRCRGGTQPRPAGSCPPRRTRPERQPHARSARRRPSDRAGSAS